MTTDRERKEMPLVQPGALPHPLPEADLVAHGVPVGYRYTVILISLLKRVLVSCPMTAPDRLELLEQLNQQVDLHIPPIALTVIQPACDTAVDFIAEALSLDPPDGAPPCRESYNVLTSSEVFGYLRRLNPSIDEALSLGFRRGAAAAPAAN